MLSVELCSGHRVCLVDDDASDAVVISKVMQAGLSTKVCVIVKRLDADQKILVGFQNDTQTLIQNAKEAQFLDKVNWSLDLDVQKWDRTKFEGDRCVELDLSEMRLTKLPQQLCRVKTLRCNHNQLTELPECLVACQTLWCGNNRLTKLPECLAACQELCCRNNQLTKLPECLAACQTLYCNDNQLTKLPECLAACQTLDCGYNQLTELPECLAACQDQLLIQNK